MTYYPEGSYEQEMFDFCERMRTMLCAGYGEGHELSRLADIIWARNEVFVRLTPSEPSEILKREAPVFHLVATGQISMKEANEKLGSVDLQPMTNSTNRAIPDICDNAADRQAGKGDEA